MARDFLGRLGGLHREHFDFAGNDGEPASGLSGPRRLDGCIESKQVGLAGDRLNELDHVADLLCRLGEPGISVVRRLGLADGVAHDGLGQVKLPADLRDRVQQFLAGAGNLRNVGGCLIGLAQGRFGVPRRQLGRAQHCGRRRLHHVRIAADGSKHFLDLHAERRYGALDRRSAAFMQKHFVALLLDLMTLGDVLVNGDPTRPSIGFRTMRTRRPSANCLTRLVTSSGDVRADASGVGPASFSSAKMRFAMRCATMAS